MKKLTLEQLAPGRLAALKNAENLLFDAEILLQNSRPTRAFFLCNIAVEELGKYCLVVSACANVIHESIDWKSFWKRFRNHTDKTTLLVHIEDLLNLNFQAKKFLSENREYAKIQEKCKFLSLYSDIDENGEFTIPDEEIDEDLAKITLELGKRRLEEMKNFETDILDSGKAFSRFTKQKIQAYREKMGISKFFEKFGG